MASKTSSMINRPTLIEHAKIRFVILDAPNNANLPEYLKEFKQLGVTDVVRTCEKTYETTLLEEAGIKTHELVFRDGEAPPEEVIHKWLSIVNDVEKKNGLVAVHCVAGLGRAPILVAIAMIEKGESFLDAVMHIRERRKGAINNLQLRYLETYKKANKSDKQEAGGNCKCIIM